jgi:hypothetical protein
VRRLILFAMVTASATASAGRTYYGWLQGTEVMPERGAEIASFISEENYLAQADNDRNTTWWIAPLIGINDQLELALPVQFAWDRSDHTPPTSTLAEYGAELKYRFVTSDPVDRPDFVPAVRVRLGRIVYGSRDVWEPEVDLIGSYEKGAVHAVVNAGVYSNLGPNLTHFAAHQGAGISIETVSDLRVGVEVYAELDLDDKGDGSWAIAGPNIAWSHGRTWLSANYGIGIYQVRDAPRVNWGIAF